MDENIIFVIGPLIIFVIAVLTVSVLLTWIVAWLWGRQNEFKDYLTSIFDAIFEAKPFAGKTSTVAGTGGIIVVLLLLLSFHIVTYPGGFVVISKEHLSLADTMLSLNEILQRYNNASLIQRVTGVAVNIHLLTELKRKGLLKDLTSEDKNAQATQAPQKYTREMFARLVKGMSYSEVVAIMGDTGRELGNVDSQGFTMAMYEWVNADGSKVFTQFNNAELVSLFQIGLH
jgi:hypothetical protein